MIGLVNREGVETTAAYGAVQQLWAYVQMPALAIGAAVSAMAAQNIGANRWDRVSQITRAGIIVNVVLTGAMVLLLTLFEEPIIGLFLGADSPALPIAARIQLLATWGFILFGMTMVLFGTVRANGAVWGPLAILFVSMYPIRLGFALGMQPLLGADALWWSFPAGSAANVALALLYYLYGPWRQGGVLIAPSRHECEEQAQATIEPAGMVKPAG